MSTVLQFDDVHGKRQRVVPGASLPRSVLHALQPMGLGTPEVESLTSYFCRLANSHACTTNDLAQFVVEQIEPGRWVTFDSSHAGKSRFLWYQRSISGVSDGALNWASALSDLTGISQLHRLTLLPLQSVVAAKGLMSTQARWCPHCLEEDRISGKQPYFRLAWDIGHNKVCAKHGTELKTRCPHCDASNVRHAANFVVPGWCTACNNFLGFPKVTGPMPLRDAQHAIELEQAQTIGSLLAASSSLEDNAGFNPDLEGFHRVLDDLATQLDSGVASKFANRIGVRKSTVHYWKTSRSPLTMDALLRVALHCNVSLADLVQGELRGWMPPEPSRQLALALEYKPTASHRGRRTHNWPKIQADLEAELLNPEPRSVSEIARSLAIDERLLYIQLTDVTRKLGDRYVRFLRERSEQAQAMLHDGLRHVCKLMIAEGEGISLENVERRVGREKLNLTRNLFTVLSNLAAQAANDHQA